ncbi:rhomboid family intramembrane serine protease [bacterium]|nr:rhomboid family intramembrane serine protease [bacterium]
MGIYDREYYQDDQTGGQFSFRSIAQWPWSYRLIGLCVVLFFVDHLLPTGDGGRLGDVGPLTIWGLYTTPLVFQSGQVWRLLTHLFVEINPQVLLFSMVTLFFFGPMIENSMGRVKFLAYYILCGVGGALLASLVAPVLLPRTSLILWGTIGPIMGLIIAAGIYHASRTVMFMFVIPMTMRNLAILSLVVDLAYVLAGSPQALAALGAAAIGYLLIQTNALSMLMDRFAPSPGWSGPPSIKLPKITAAFTPKPVSNDELDRLLEKVHEHGIGSLTHAEKSILKRASKQRRQS